ETHDLEKQLTFFVAVWINLNDLRLGVADNVWLRHEPFAAKPCCRLLVSLAPDQVEHPAALVGFVVEPTSLSDVDRQRAASPVARFVAILRRGLAEQADSDRLYQRVEVNVFCEIHETPRSKRSSAAPRGVEGCPWLSRRSARLRVSSGQPNCNASDAATAASLWLPGFRLWRKISPIVPSAYRPIVAA